jgi:hypothetical protein
MPTILKPCARNKQGDIIHKLKKLTDGHGHFFTVCADCGSYEVTTQKYAVGLSKASR